MVLKKRHHFLGQFSIPLIWHAPFCCEWYHFVSGHLGVLKDVYNHGGCKEGPQFLEVAHGGVPGTLAPSRTYLTVSLFLCIPIGN